jgi:hypothetical protein
MRGFAIGVAVAAISIGCGESEAPVAGEVDPSAAGAIVAEAGNQPPIIESVRLDPAEPAQGATVQAVVMARDPDGQRVTLGHRWFVDGGERQTGDASLVLDGVGKGAEIRVSVTATDGALESAPVEASARVIDRPPSITSASLSPQDSVSPGQPVSAQVGSVDPDGDLVDFEYVWFVNDERREASGSLFATDGLANGDAIHAEVRATDGTNWTEPERTPPVTVGSAHPEITSTPPGFREDGVFRYRVEAVDPDGDKRLRYALEEGPEGMAIDAVLGELVWRPRDDQHGVHPVSVVVRDSTGLSTKQSFSVTVQESKKDAPADADAPEEDEAR